MLKRSSNVWRGTKKELRLSRVIPIPAEVFESKCYHDLRIGDRAFLMDLYYLYGDCERFVINPEDFQGLSFGPKADIASKVRGLVDGGFLVFEMFRECARRGRSRRVFRFAHQALEAA